MTDRTCKFAPGESVVVVDDDGATEVLHLGNRHTVEHTMGTYVQLEGRPDNEWWDEDRFRRPTTGDDHLTVNQMWRNTEYPLKDPARFETKDSGQRVDYPSGMRRDVDTGKPRYDLIPRFMLKRLAELYARGAQKYGEDNYTLADSEEELKRFKASAFRHFVQWLDGERDEDHGAAVFFNIAAAEMTEQKVRANEDLKLLMGVTK